MNTIKSVNSGSISVKPRPVIDPSLDVWKDYSGINILSEREKTMLRKICNLSFLAGKCRRWGSKDMDALYTYVKRHYHKSNDFLIMDVWDQEILPNAAHAALNKAITRVQSEYFEKQNRDELENKFIET